MTKQSKTAMSFPKEFLRPVEVQSKTGFDDFHDDGDDSPWNAWFHRFTEGTNRNHPKPEAMAIVEREDGEVLVVPLCKYIIRFTDRGS